MKNSKKLDKMMEVIKDYINENGYPPSMRDIKKAMDFKSISTVSYYLDKAQEEGLLKKGTKRNRALEIVGAKTSYQEEEEQKPNLVRIPVLGTITAGFPVLAVQTCEEYFMVSPNLFKGEDLFMLNVSGESMINAGIYDGDKVVIRKQSTATNGEIVAAMLDGMATVKRFYKENGRFRLQPENDTMSPIYTDDVIVLGKVIGLVRKF